MKNKIIKISFFIAVLAVAALIGVSTFAVESPTADAGPNLYLDSGQTGILQGSGTDPNGYSLNYYWNCTGGSLSNNSIAQPIYTAPHIYQFNNQATFTCNLTVTNSYGYSSSDQTTIYVNYGNAGNLQVQTNSATSISGNHATLNGYVTNPNYGNTVYVWFEWGTGTNYGNETYHQTKSGSASFVQNISNLSSGTTYHFRSAARLSNGYTVYGQDKTFNTSGTAPENLVVTKKVINLTSGNLNWQTSVSTKPGDILSFVTTVKAQSADAHNVFVKDTLPQNFIYKGNLTLNSNINYSSNPMSGINIGTLPAGQVYVIAYQAQVPSAQNFSYGTTTLSSGVVISSSNAESKTASTQVSVNNSIVSGAVNVPTGITNTSLNDSLFLPIIIILTAFWLYFSGSTNKFADWLRKTKK